MLYSKICLGGMVIVFYYLVVQVGVQILCEGGNVVEVMVVVVVVIVVVYLYMNGIGGDGFWVISELGQELVVICVCGFLVVLVIKEFYVQYGYSVVFMCGLYVVLMVVGVVGGWVVVLEYVCCYGCVLLLLVLLVDVICYVKNGVFIICL